MKPIQLVLSCEHAVNTIPPAYQSLFHQHQSVLDTHRAIDFGAKTIATHLSQTLGTELTCATASRLLIDCNRSLGHPRCLSEFSNTIAPEEQQHIINAYYLPFRKRVQTLIDAHIKTGHQVLHLSIHSFTPSFNGVIRNAGIGLLYDPTRHGEKEVARQWHGLLLQQTPAYRIRMNYPYRGTSDGFTSALRKQHSEHDYLGLEVETNQALVTEQTSLEAVSTMLSNSLQALLQLL